MIIPWKNDGKERNKKIKLFRISFNTAGNKWVKDPKGKYWGFHESDSSEKNIKVPTQVMKRGKEKSLDLNVDLTFGTPSLGVVKDEE